MILDTYMPSIPMSLISIKYSIASIFNKEKLKDRIEKALTILKNLM